MIRLLLVPAASVLGFAATLPHGALPSSPLTNGDVELLGGSSTPISFGAEVRPILARSCLPCHGFDPSTREAGLRLDRRDEAVKPRGRSGDRAIAPGDPAASLILERVSTDDEWDRMPPEGEPLSAEEIDLLSRWIEQGAEYEAHWSWEPIAETPADIDPSSAIDAFIDERIASAGLEVAPPADRRTLLRRLSFDLIGLPPTPEEIASFERDTSPNAVEAEVDRLLASPHFGERQARHWLDLFRYAETYGHEFDYPIPGAWAYRDSVVRAFDADVGFDRMILEHVAGDLLDDPRIDPDTGHDDSLLATGSWWLVQGTHGPTDVRLDELERFDNQIDVISKAFMATTVSCARCHDHKFDPVTQADYYGFAGYLQSSRRQVAYLDPKGAIADGVERLEQLDLIARATLDNELARRLGSANSEVAGLLLGAREVLTGEPTPGESVPEPRVTLFEGFDADDWGDWTAEGDAFSAGPYPAVDTFIGGSGSARGTGFANSHVREDDGDSRATDLLTGSLTSPRFVIEHDELHVRIGGGRHPGRTGLRLETDAGVVLELTGHDSLEFRSEVLDLRELEGERARIVIFDEVTGGWGNIRVDELLFADEGDFETLAPTRSVRAVASERGLDADRLASWTDAMRRVDLDEPNHPLVPLFVEPVGPLSDSPGPSLESWAATGFAFGDEPVAAGTWLAPGKRTVLADSDRHDSGVLSDALLGTLRSPTFEIEAPHLLARVRGEGHGRLIIDGFHLDEHNDLLFEGVKRSIRGDGWHWISHDLTDYVGHRAYYELVDESTAGSVALDDLRWSDTGASPSGSPFGSAGSTDASVRAALSGVRTGDRWGAALINWALEHELLDDANLSQVRGEFAAVEASLPTPTRAVAMADGTAEDEFVLLRGNHTSPGDVAPRGFIEALDPGGPEGAALGSGRLELARWMLADDNPLTARVMANRVWHHLFGRGLVATTDDFGLLGEAPSHPELLDHLGQRLREDLDWSPKALIREIVLSDAYQRASAEPAEADPDNLLLAHRSPKRLDGESLRDAMLSISGELDTTRFGPSVPLHLTDFLTGRGRPSTSGPLDGDGRRSLYIEVRRNFLDPFFSVFDTPVPHSTQGCRNRSNVPTQSLALMNAPLVAELSERFAARLTRLDIESDDARIDALWRLALGRLPTESERAACTSFLADWSSEAGAPWADLCHVVFNSKEFSFVE